MASIVVRTLLIYFVIMISLKIMGKRQIGELEVGELVSTLLISEIAAIPIDEPDIPLLNAIIPILFILSVEIILSYSKNRINLLKKYCEGSPVFLVYKSELIKDAFIENRISINEFLSEMRSQGIGSCKEIKYAMLEQSGKISIIKDSEAQFDHAVIIDGDYNEYELSRIKDGRKIADGELLRRRLKACDVFLMTLDDSGDITIIRKEKK